MTKHSELLLPATNVPQIRSRPARALSFWVGARPGHGVGWAAWRLLPGALPLFGGGGFIRPITLLKIINSKTN